MVARYRLAGVLAAGAVLLIGGAVALAELAPLVGIPSWVGFYVGMFWGILVGAAVAVTLGAEVIG